jgi:twitching motility protein PilI
MADSASRSHVASFTTAPFGAPVSSRDGVRSLTTAGASTGASSKLVTINRRDRLREFQTGLADKLRRAQGTPLAVNRLGVQIGPHRLLVDLADAGEILAVPEIMPVPLTKPWYRGLANVRGSLLGVVDLSLFAGGPPTPLDKESRVLAFSADLQFSTGLLISRMLGLRSAADLVADDATTASQALFAPWVRARLCDAQEVHWQEIDLAALTADPRFLDIARG